MAATFVKVEEESRVRELYEADLLYRKTLCNVEGEVIPQISHVVYGGHQGKFFMARWWTEYGYMAED